MKFDQQRHELLVFPDVSAVISVQMGRNVASCLTLLVWASLLQHGQKAHFFVPTDGLFVVFYWSFWVSISCCFVLLYLKVHKILLLNSLFML